MLNKTKNNLTKAWTYIWRNALTTLAGLQANLDGIWEGINSKAFWYSIIAILIYAMMPDDTFGKIHDKINKRNSTNTETETNSE